MRRDMKILSLDLYRQRFAGSDLTGRAGRDRPGRQHPKRPMDQQRADLGSESGYGTFPGSGNWPAPIQSNVGGDATLNKTANGAGGGPYPASGSIYFGGFSGDQNVNGGTLAVTDNSPVANLQTVVFQARNRGSLHARLLQRGAADFELQWGQSDALGRLHFALPGLQWHGGDADRNGASLHQYLRSAVGLYRAFPRRSPRSLSRSTGCSMHRFIPCNSTRATPSLKRCRSLPPMRSSPWRGHLFAGVCAAARGWLIPNLGDRNQK